MNDRAPTPEELRRAAEKRELLRMLNARIVENHERGWRLSDPEMLASARAFLAANPPLVGPMGTGDPAHG